MGTPGNRGSAQGPLLHLRADAALFPLDVAAQFRRAVGDYSGWLLWLSAFSRAEQFLSEYRAAAVARSNSLPGLCVADLDCRSSIQSPFAFESVWTAGAKQGASSRFQLDWRLPACGCARPARLRSQRFFGAAVDGRARVGLPGIADVRDVPMRKGLAAPGNGHLHGRDGRRWHPCADPHPHQHGSRRSCEECTFRRSRVAPALLRGRFRLKLGCQHPHVATTQTVVKTGVGPEFQIRLRLSIPSRADFYEFLDHWPGWNC